MSDDFDVNNATDEIVAKPPKVIIYGEHGIGKTTFAAAFPSPILLMTEEGVGSLRIKRFPKVVTEYHELMMALGSLAQSEHDRETLIVDSLDWLEPIIWAETCKRNSKSNIEDWDYGKGYVFAEEVWDEVIRGFDYLHVQRNMSIVCIAHSQVIKFQSPTNDPFDKYALKLNKRASALIQEWSDIVAFAHWDTNTTSTDLGFKRKATRGVSSGTRLLALEARPAWDAKNRFQLPPIIPLDIGATHFFALLAERYNPAPVIEAPAAEQALEPTLAPKTNTPNKE